MPVKISRIFLILMTERVLSFLALDSVAIQALNLCTLVIACRDTPHSCTTSHYGLVFFVNIVS